MLGDMYSAVRLLACACKLAYVQEKGLKVIEDAAEMIGQCGP